MNADTAKIANNSINSVIMLPFLYFKFNNLSTIFWTAPYCVLSWLTTYLFFLLNAWGIIPHPHSCCNQGCTQGNQCHHVHLFTFLFSVTLTNLLPFLMSSATKAEANTHVFVLSFFNMGCYPVSISSCVLKTMQRYNEKRVGVSFPTRFRTKTALFLTYIKLLCSYTKYCQPCSSAPQIPQ